LSGGQGHLAASSSSYDLLLTQRLILQPQVEVNVYSKGDPARGGRLVGAGFRHRYRLRLRYEFSRKIRALIGVVYEGNSGQTANFARRAGESTDDVRFAPRCPGLVLSAGMRTIIAAILVTGLIVTSAGWPPCIPASTTSARRTPLAVTRWVLETAPRARSGACDRYRSSSGLDDQRKSRWAFRAFRGALRRLSRCTRRAKGDIAPVFILRLPTLRLREALQAGELFWIIKHGIKMTGMPAWLTTATKRSGDRRFYRKPPRMTQEEYGKAHHGEHGSWRPSPSWRSKDENVDALPPATGQAAHPITRAPGIKLAVSYADSFQI